MDSDMNCTALLLPPLILMHGRVPSRYQHQLVLACVNFVKATYSCCSAAAAAAQLLLVRPHDTGIADAHVKNVTVECSGIADAHVRSHCVATAAGGQGASLSSPPLSNSSHSRTDTAVCLPLPSCLTPAHPPHRLHTLPRCVCAPCLLTPQRCHPCCLQPWAASPAASESSSTLRGKQAGKQAETPYPCMQRCRDQLYCGAERVDASQCQHGMHLQ
jgi:hypothetical protein